MYESDYIMRQIRLLTDSISQLIFQRHATVDLLDEDGNLQGSGVLYHKLRALVNEGRINDAENLLFFELDSNPIPDTFEVALQFYQDLLQLSDIRLADCAFSRAEIETGLREVQDRIRILQ